MNRTSARNWGIDLLRVVALLGVIVLHIMGHGKVLSSSESNAHFALNWALEILVYPAVNCFVLVSGFVGYREGNPFPKAKNILSLWLTVLFYSVVVTLILALCFPQQVGSLDIVRSFFPVLTDRYWFFTCYFGMFLFSPALNALADALDHVSSWWLGGIAIVIFSGSTLVGDPFVLDGGYTVLWFLVLYLLGALMKKTQLTQTIPMWGCALLAGGPFLVTCLFKWAERLGDGTVVTFLAQNSDRIVSYTSPTVLLTAIGTVCLFSRIPIGTKGQAVLRFFAPTAFSVYLIHDHSLFRRLVMKGRFAWLNTLHPLATVALVAAFAVGIFLTCAVADKMRDGLFRLCRTDCLVEWMASLPSKIRTKHHT